MGLNVRLVNQQGAEVQWGLDDADDTVDRYLPQDTDERFVLLRFIDPYDDTIFNRWQMQALRPEIALLLQETHDETGIALLQNLDDMARKCQETRFLYLKFLGD